MSVMARVTCTAVVDKVLSAHGHWVLTGVVYQVRGAPWFPCKNGFREERRLLHEEYAEHLKLGFCHSPRSPASRSTESVCPGVGRG